MLPAMKPLKICHILSLDGGGAKGFYTLGALTEMEALVGRNLCASFDLIFGTSTGAIIAALLGLDYSVAQIKTLYSDHVVKVMGRWLPYRKSAALEELAREVFGAKKFDSFQTRIGIVGTRWDEERPIIFKTHGDQAYAGAASFVPGFGATIGDAVVASCSAYPFFKRKFVEVGGGTRTQVGDGGFVANNPALFAIADATELLGFARADIRLVSIGVGEYPAPKLRMWKARKWLGKLPSVRLLQKTLEINTQSMDQLRKVLYRQVPTIRISNRYTQPEMATDMFEANRTKLDLIYSRGRDSAREVEERLREFLI
jgi:predicted acylesterase/phospholipase RssA